MRGFFAAFPRRRRGERSRGDGLPSPRDPVSGRPLPRRESRCRRSCRTAGQALSRAAPAFSGGASAGPATSCEGQRGRAAPAGPGLVSGRRGPAGARGQRAPCYPGCSRAGSALRGAPWPAVSVDGNYGVRICVAAPRVVPAAGPPQGRVGTSARHLLRAENTAVGLGAAPLEALSLRRGERGPWEPERKIAVVGPPGQAPSGPCLARAAAPRGCPTRPGWQGCGALQGFCGMR